MARGTTISLAERISARVYQRCPVTRARSRSSCPPVSISVCGTRKKKSSSAEKCGLPGEHHGPHRRSRNARDPVLRRSLPGGQRQPRRSLAEIMNPYGLRQRALDHPRRRPNSPVAPVLRVSAEYPDLDSHYPDQNTAESCTERRLGALLSTGLRVVGRPLVIAQRERSAVFYAARPRGERPDLPHSGRQVVRCGHLAPRVSLDRQFGSRPLVTTVS